MNSKQVFVYYKVFMGLLYVAMGLYIVSSPAGLATLLGKTGALIVGTLVAAYGGFRFYRAWFVDRKQHQNDSEKE